MEEESLLGKKRGPQNVFTFNEQKSPLTTVDLTKYPETRFLSKNKKLQAIFSEIENEGIQDKTILKAVEPLIRRNLWREFDAFCRGNQGIENFFKILQAIFYLYYYSPNESRISFDAKEKAMGIQQVRWSFDPANTFKPLENYSFRDGEFIYFQEIDKPNRLNIIDSFISRSKIFLNTETVKKIEIFIMKVLNINTLKFGYGDIFNDDNLTNAITTRFGNNILFIQKFLTIIEKIGQYAADVSTFLTDINALVTTARTKIEDFLQDTIWYEATGNEFNVFKQKSPLLLIGETNFFYGIPATYNISRLICYHEPILVFGSIRPKTMINFIIKEKKRPFAAHLPGAASNLEEFDKVTGNILINWIHDLNHQSEGFNCNTEELIVRSRQICVPFEINSPSHVMLYLATKQFEDELQGKSAAEKYLMVEKYFNIFFAYKFRTQGKLDPYLKDKTEEEQSKLLEEYETIFKKINPVYERAEAMTSKERQEILKESPSVSTFFPSKDAKADEWLKSYFFQNCIENNYKGLKFLDKGDIYENVPTPVFGGRKKTIFRRSRQQNQKRRRKTYKRRRQ